ncbi:MAG: hypothetical protein LBI99_02430, partial [Propionibacteriaceae bacterium]|nr:hypothetical protein [Propionibacteriaceae bacterium]
TSAPFAPDGVRWDTLPFDSGICVAGAAQFAVGGQVTRIRLDGPEVVALPEPGLISTNEDGSLMADAVGSVTATIQGDDYIFPGSEAGFPAEFPDSLLGNKLVITSQGDRREVDLGELTGVFAVSLSPDGSKAAVQTEFFVRVYDTATAELLYAMPSMSKQVYWLDDNSFFCQGERHAGSLYLADIAKQESYGLISEEESTNVTIITGMADNYLYFVSVHVIGSVRDGYRIEMQ